MVLGSLKLIKIWSFTHRRGRESKRPWQTQLWVGKHHLRRRFLQRIPRGKWSHPRFHRWPPRRCTCRQVLQTGRSWSSWFLCLTTESVHQWRLCKENRLPDSLRGQWRSHPTSSTCLPQVRHPSNSQFQGQSTRCSTLPWSRDRCHCHSQQRRTNPSRQNKWCPLSTDLGLLKRKHH